MINVTKTFLPPFEEYSKYLKQIWESHWVTNQGPLAVELEEKLKKFLGVNNLLLVSNGTIALQLAIKALDLKGEIITTPYSYVATTTSILWENCIPVFCDIEENTFCIDSDKIETLISENTSAILATHVYGFPCNVNKIKSIADKYGLKVIYDGAHAFGVRMEGHSVFDAGDISTVSFHATKLFHTIEGGAVITSNEKLAEKIYLYRAFGHLDDDYFSIGINGRTSEFNAAMGLCNLGYVDDFIKERKEINILYRKHLGNLPLLFPLIPRNIEYNYAYFPVFFYDESAMKKAMNILEHNNIFPRRYFYPSLNKLPYLNKNNSVGKYDCPVSEDISSRVLCLPVYHNLDEETIELISRFVTASF